MAETREAAETTQEPIKSINNPNIEKLYNFYGKKIHDIYTQIEIQEKYGKDMLVELYKYEESN